MPLQMQYDSGKKLICVTAVGVVTFEEFDQCLQQITESTEFTNDAPALWDLRPFDFSSLNRDAIMQFIRVRERYTQRDNARIAVVVNSSVGFGLSRMYEMITAVRKNPQNVRTFRDLAEGEEWLLSNTLST